MYKKIIISQSENVSNPLEDMGIICLNRNNSKHSEMPSKMKALNEQGYKLERVFCYDHGGRVFKRHSFNDQWDSYLYGIFAFPQDMDLTEEFLDSIYEEYTQWAEGEVYDYIVLNETSDIKVDSVLDYYLEKIDFDSMFENRDSLIMDFMKENKISIKSVEDIYSDNRFTEFRNQFLGKTKQGYIYKKELDNLEWTFEIFGLDNLEKEFKEG